MVKLQRVLQFVFLHQHVDHRFRERQLPVFESTLQHALAQLRLLQFLFLEIATNLVLGFFRDHRIQPIGTRRLLLARDDFHLVAIFQLMADGHHASVDAGTVAGLTHAGMHLVGKVEHGGADGELFQVAFGRENEDFI